MITLLHQHCLTYFTEKDFYMNHFKIRHAFRLDEATEQALQKLATSICQTKASLMRRFIQEGVGREAK